MNRTTRIALLGGATLLAILFYGFGSSDAPAMNTDPAYAEAATAYERDPSGAQGAFGAPDSGQRGRVVLVDRGLQLPLGTQELPEGWTLTQDLATNPQTGEMDRHTLDVRGPQGELIRALGIAHYGSMAGTSLEQAWRQAAVRGLQGDVEGLSLGALRRSASVEASPGYRRAAAKAAQYGFRVDGLEAPVGGQRGGEPVEGVVYLTRFSSDQVPGAGTLQLGAVVSPPGRLAAARQAEGQIAASFQPNPEHQARVEGIGQAARQQSAALHQSRMMQIDRFGQQMTAGHNQRMADSRASFNAHQQRMQGRWDAADQQVAGWQAQQRSGDEIQRRTINGINGTADVYDAQTGTTHYGVPDNGAGHYWVDPTNNAVVGTDAYSDNPDPYRYNSATNLDDVYNSSGGE